MIEVCRASAVLVHQTSSRPSRYMSTHEKQVESAEAHFNIYISVVYERMCYS